MALGLVPRITVSKSHVIVEANRSTRLGKARHHFRSYPAPLAIEEGGEEISRGEGALLQAGDHGADQAKHGISSAGGKRHVRGPGAPLKGDPRAGPAGWVVRPRNTG
jgi:hypothetical protein